MGKRVYIHPAQGMEGRRKMTMVGAGALLVLGILGIQLRLTFSERAIAKAQQEFDVFGQNVADGLEQAKPESQKVEAVKDTLGTFSDGIRAQVEAGIKLDAAVQEAAARLNAEPAAEPATDNAQVAETVPSEISPTQPPASLTLPTNP